MNRDLVLIPSKGLRDESSGLLQGTPVGDNRAPTVSHDDGGCWV